MPAAGEMKDRITLIAPGALDAWGHRPAGVSVEVWGAVSALKAADRTTSNAILSASSLTAVIRWMDGITLAWRATVRGETYNIIAVEPDGRQWITLYLAKR